MKDIETDAVIFNLKYSDDAAVKNKGAIRNARYMPNFTGIHINHVICDGAQAAFVVNGSVIPMVRNITVKNSVFKTKYGISSTLSDSITFNHCSFTVKKKPAVKLQQTRYWIFNKCSFNQPSGTMIQLTGTKNADIEFNQTPIRENWIKYLEGASKQEIKIKK